MPRFSSWSVLVLTVAATGCGHHHRDEPSDHARVSCWGSNYLGQLGASRSNDKLHAVGEGSDATDLMAFESTTCARAKLGPWRCWGAHEASLDPLLGLANVETIRVGSDHACALRHDGSVVCTGDDARRVSLANAHIADPLDDSTTRYEIRTDGRNTAIKSIGAAPAPIKIDIPPVVTIAGLTDAVELSLGRYHACARRSNGSVVCWGEGRFGQLGAATTRSVEPVTIAGMTDATAIASGGLYSCAVRRNGTVWCWGSLESSLSNGEPHPQPQPIAGITGATAVAITTDAMSDESRACAVIEAGRVMCWTRNEPATPIADVAGITQLVAGMRHFCARLATGHVACWGSNEMGESGPHDADSPNVSGLSDVTQIVAGARHTCVRRAN